jgi:hypothetical protein
MQNETTSALAKLSPAAGVSGATMFGFPLPDVVLLMTLFYTGLQVFILVRDKIYRPWKEKRNGRDRQGTR